MGNRKGKVKIKRKKNELGGKMVEFIEKSMGWGMEVMIRVGVMKLEMERMVKEEKERFIEGKNEYKEKVERIRREIGMDRKDIEKLESYLKGIISGDMGK